MQGYEEAVAYARWAMTHLREGRHFFKKEIFEFPFTPAAVVFLKKPAD